MKALWFAIDPEYMDYEAIVDRCVLHGDTINITFSTKEEHVPIEGRLSLKAVNTEQVATGYWRYPAPRIQTPKISGLLGRICG